MRRRRRGKPAPAPRRRRGAAAPLLSTDTVFHADGPIQRVRVTQAFRNSLPQRQEGLYVLRLPSDATLERLTVSVRAAAEGDQGEIDDALPPSPATPCFPRKRPAS